MRLTISQREPVVEDEQAPTTATPNADYERRFLVAD
jgi:hypothetical protein